MSRRSKLLFLLLMLVQAAHSVEEYVTRLFEVFTPARVVSGLIADNPAVGFAALNAAFTGAYFSGALTAVLLVVTAVCLALSLFRDRMHGAHDALRRRSGNWTAEP